MTVYLLIEIADGYETVDSVHASRASAEARQADLLATVVSLGMDDVSFRIDAEKVQGGPRF